MTSKVLGTPPATLLGNLITSLDAATWITPADNAAIALANRLAIALDTAFDTGELKEVPALAQRYTAILQQLHLTVETRIQGKQEVENDGSGHSGNYLRLLEAATRKPAAKSS